MYEDLTFVFDVDGTLCPVKKDDERYEDIVPYKEMVEKIREYKAGGAKIVLLTSRNMNSFNGNIGLINANTAKVLLAWLDKWAKKPITTLLRSWRTPRKKLRRFSTTLKLRLNAL